MMKCEFCQNHEQGDTLYESSDWDGGIGFDYIRDIKYCPLCGSLLNGEAKTESIIEVYNGNANKENWQCITIKPIEDEPQMERPSCETCKWDSEEWYDEHCGSCVAHTDKPSYYEPQIEYDKYHEKIRAHDPHKDW